VSASPSQTHDPAVGVNGGVLQATLPPPMRQSGHLLDKRKTIGSARNARVSGATMVLKRCQDRFHRYRTLPAAVSPVRHRATAAAMSQHIQLERRTNAATTRHQTPPTVVNRIRYGPRDSSNASGRLAKTTPITHTATRRRCGSQSITSQMRCPPSRWASSASLPKGSVGEHHISQVGGQIAGDKSLG
jgi:hypothetical protein